MMGNLKMTKTVGDLARAYDVSPQTIRVWCKQFEGYLSDQAKPTTGETRIFNENDIGVLALVGLMRANDRASYEEIREALEAGKRAAIPDDAPGDTGETQPGAEMVTVLTATLARYEGQIEEIRQERDYLRGELTEAQQREREALERAARLEGRLEAQQGREAPQSAPEPPTEATEAQPARRSLWDRLRMKR